MDNMPAIEQPPAVENQEAAALPVRPVRVLSPPPSPTERRKIKSRHPFDIYEDQVEQLKQLSLEDRMHGGNGSMSAMVREAIDAYIALKRN
jgi:hypothetical protein